MRLKLILVLIFVFIVSSTTHGFLEEADFEWGMSKEEVKKNEPLTLDYEDENSIRYENSFKTSYLDAEVILEFDEDKLYMITWIIYFNHPDPVAYTFDYDKLKKGLIEEYGDPITEEIFWVNEFYKDKEEYLGYALENGIVEYLTYWETDTTKIDFWLGGVSKEILLCVRYWDKNYKGNASKDS